MGDMSWRSKGLPLVISAIFIIQIVSPLFAFPVEESLTEDSKESNSVGFSSGSGHDIEGDLIEVDGKNWTVRGESVLDYWNIDHRGIMSDKPMDLVVTDVGIGYACSLNSSDVNLHTIHLNGTMETLLVESLSNGLTADECGVAIGANNRIQVVYNVDDDIRLARLAEVNSVYLERTWHLRTIVEDVFNGGLEISFDSEFKSHIMFQDVDLALHHLWFNKAFWNQTILDVGPVGDDIEIVIDSEDVVHVVYTNSAEGEVRLVKFNETMEVRQVLARANTVSSAIGMDLDTNDIEQITYSKSDGLGNNTLSLLRSLAGKDTGRIDPIPNWIINYDDDSVEGELLAGDLNGDGKDDIVYTDPDGNGTISIHYGSPDGPGALADRILVGSYSDSMLGTGIAIGDFNCDGFDDIASSEPGLGMNNSGHISIRLGSATGVSTSTWWEMNGSEDDNLGWSLTSLGDVESDGCTDLAVVADKMILENSVASQSQNGLVMILKGNNTSMVHHGNITQTGSGTMFGRQVIGNGDINGDGYMDMAISNTDSMESPTGYSSVEFFLGNSSGINITAVTTFSPLDTGRLYGVEMSFVGDVDGDGFDDILISELFASTTPYHSGKIHMWGGSSSGPVKDTWSDKGSFGNALLGQTISPAGDINEDGYSDFLVMAPSSTKAGKVHLYLGSQNGPRIETQIFAQGSAGQNVGLNLLTGIDVNGDGMGELIYSSRDLDRGESFGPVLTLMSERDWEYIDFQLDQPVVGIEMHTPLRGTPSIMAMLDDSSLLLMENTLDGTPSGRWLTRELTTAHEANIGISNAGNPIILYHSSGEIMSLSLTGNTAIEFALGTGNSLGEQMDSTIDSNGYQRLGHSSSGFSSIFYTEESATGFTTSTVRGSIDLAYPIGIHLDTEDLTRMVYVDDDDNMVRMATLDGSWTETSILNTTIGDDFESLISEDTLMFVQVAVSNNSTMLQFVEYDNGTTTVTDIMGANLTSQFEFELIGDKIAIALIDSDHLIVLERQLSGGNWSVASDTWLLGVTEGHSLAMSGQVILFDANNSIQGLLIEDGNGSWDHISVEIPDTNSSHEFLIDNGRWHSTSTNEQNHLVWTTGLVQSSNAPVLSTSFPAISTENPVPLDAQEDGTIMFAYSQSSNGDFYTLRLETDTDRDLIPDSHDNKPQIGNQWEDSDSDGYGDNPLGPAPDACPSENGVSYIDKFGCDDYDEDGWSDVADDCANDDGMSWWAMVGCDDLDQDGWADNSPTFVNGDRFPTNWKQAIDSDGDRIGDNHGPDCCETELETSELAQTPDLFPYNSKQWKDDDNDGYGDNDSDQESGDKCWWIQGFSYRDRLGCVDTDGDGASDPSDFGTSREWNEEDGADWWPEDGTQWADSDGDGYGDNSSDGATLPDKFPTNPAAANDTDNDGYPNNWTSLENGSNRAGLYLDNCPNEYGNSTSSLDSQGAIVAYYGCTDTDGDGREDATDAFPDDSTQLADSDGDGWGDNQQGNQPDKCPYDYGVINGTMGAGCPIVGDIVDTDNDGVSDDIDGCNNTAEGQDVDSVGCSEYQKDDDQDFVSNAEDMCPSTPVGETVDGIGCSDSQKEIDSDGDGIFDPYDSCPDSNPELTIDENGCNLAQKDSDGDTINDLLDECPGTEIGIPVLSNGCLNEAALAEDIDGDGYKGPYSYNPDTDTHEGDAFPLDVTQWEDMDGDGYGDSQAPGANESDDCPEVWGNSTMKSRFGCLDSDGDGYHDFLGDDKFPQESTQWEDKDLDSWGDNPDGVDADQCLNTSAAGDRTAQARINFGCADYQSDTDGDGVFDDIDACMNTESGATVTPRGCKIEEAETSDSEGDMILGMSANLFLAISGIGGILIIVLVVTIIRRLSGNNLDLEDDDWDDDEDDDDDDFMSRGSGGIQSRGPPGGAGPSRGPPGGAGPSRGPPGGAGPSRGPPGGAGPSRGPPGGPNRGQQPSLDPRGPARGQSVGKKVAKRKPIGDKVRKSKLVIDPDLFSQDELKDRVAAVDWTKDALKDGTDERSILMQLQTTGWSAPQSRAIIDLSKQ